MKRYLVIDVGCLECAEGQSCDPKRILDTDDADEAVKAATKGEWSRQYDMFVVDTQTGALITPNGRKGEGTG